LNNHFQERERNIDMTRSILTPCRAAGSSRPVRFLTVLACSLALMGCEDEEKKKALAEAAETKMSLAKVKADLTMAKSQVAYLKEELEAAKETRNELQEQAEPLVGERDIAMAAAEKAQERIKNLTAQLNEQAEKEGILRKDIKELELVIENQEKTIAEQQVTIEELQKIIEQQQGDVEEQQENTDMPEHH
jgi:chromosome segregation ATPase